MNMKKMTSKERELAMLAGEKPDRVPVFELNAIVGAQVMGYEWKDVRFDGKLTSKLVKEFARMTGTDIVHTWIETNSMFLDFPGMEVKLSDNNYSNVISHYFNEPEDVDNKPMHDPANRKESEWLWKGVLDKTKNLVGKDNEYMVEQWSWSVMSAAGFLRNVEALLMDVLLEPDIAHKVLAKSAVFVDGIIRAGIDLGADVALLPDPTSSGSLIDGDTLRKFITPHLKKMIGNYEKEFGVPSYIHVCGESEPVAEAVAELGAKLFSFDYMVNIKELRRLMGDKIILAGNLDPMNIVWMGTPEMVMEGSKKIIEDAEGKPFVLATGCETPRDAPLVNLQAMTAAADKYGKY